MKADKYTLKEESDYNLRITFKVLNDIVSGLRHFSVVKKNGIKVDSAEQVLGSFAPTVEPHVVDLECMYTPSGFFSRGTYKGKSMLLDVDGTVHM